MRVSTSMIPPRSAIVPALRLLPAPRGTTGSPSSLATASTPATSAVEPGKTTTSGRPR
jgi:hypothetical protein